VAAEIGCAGSNKLALSIAKLDPAGPTIALPDVTVDVTAPGASASAPTVTWILKRREWWVTWHDAAGQRLFLRRFNEAGAPASGVVDLGAGVEGAVRGDAYIEASHGVSVGIVQADGVVNLPVSCL
jgi:hypothetical protein